MVFFCRVFRARFNRLLNGYVADIEDKRRLMGEARCAPSAHEEKESSGGPAAAEEPSGQQPMHYESMLPQVYEELIHRVCAKAVIDLTSKDGVLATVCLLAGVPYLGLTFGSAHSDALKARLSKVMFNKFVDERATEHYKPKLAKLLCVVGA